MGQKSWEECGRLCCGQGSICQCIPFANVHLCIEKCLHASGPHVVDYACLQRPCFDMSVVGCLWSELGQFAFCMQWCVERCVAVLYVREQIASAQITGALWEPFMQWIEMLLPCKTWCLILSSVKVRAPCLCGTWLKLHSTHSAAGGM